MRFSLEQPGVRRGILAGFCLALIVLAVAEFASVGSIRAYASAASAVTQSADVKRALEAVMGAAAAAEGSARGFALSGDPHFLHRYLERLADAEDAFTRARALVSNDPAQADRVERVAAVFSSRTDSLRAWRERAEAGDRAGAASAIATEQGAEAMARLRALVTEAQGVERARLAERSDHAARALERARTLTLFTAAAAVFMLGSMLWFSISLTRSLASTRRAETERDRAMRTFERITRTTPDIVVVTEVREARIIFCNRGFHTILGYSDAEARAWPDAAARVVHPDDLPSVRDFRARAATLLDGEFTAVEHRAIHADGSERWIQVRGTPFERDAAGNVSSLLFVAQDVTERKRQELEIRRLNESLERQVEARTAELKRTIGELEAFCYSVSHDLRAPLRAMQGFATALREDYAHALGTEGGDWTGRIIAAATRMDGLIQDLLALSRLTRAQVRPGPVSLDDAVSEALAQNEAVLKAARVTVERPLPPVVAERAVLAQVLANLISNAAKFVKPGTTPSIAICAETRGDVVRVSVRDEGIGIDPQYHDRVWRVFERLHAADAFPGTGIGLAIVRKGVERLGGRVGLDSAPGLGAEFWFELPAREVNHERRTADPAR